MTTITTTHPIVSQILFNSKYPFLSKSRLRISPPTAFFHCSSRRGSPLFFFDTPFSLACYRVNYNDSQFVALMWPLYLLFNKGFKTEEDERVSDRERSSFLGSLADDDDNPFVLSRSHFVEVPHVNQLYAWDCGLACVLMVFRTFGIDSHNIESLAALCHTTSVWTVDLAYLLQQFSVNFSYYTVTFGVNPNYSVETFYKEQLPSDLVRVDMLFKRSLEAGIKIECRSISKEEMSHLILSGKYIAIALVDQHKLSPSWLKDVFLTDFNDSNSNYTGHYVIICGYDSVTDEFEIRDPASSWKNVKITSNCLEKARKSFGTDEDLLLISLDKIDIKQFSSSPQLSRVYSIVESESL